MALLWLTVFNVYLGRSRNVLDPEGYDRLFQVIDRAIDPSDREEHQMIWFFVSTMLFVHMQSAGFIFEPSRSRHDDPRDEANALIDIISKRHRT